MEARRGRRLARRRWRAWRGGILAGAVLAAGPWLAAAPRGGFGGGTGPFTPNGTQPPIEYEMLPPGNCRSCHGFEYDPVNHVEPWETWAGSMMANAGRDPIFWAALDVANNDVPGIGEFCLRCHAPAAWLDGRASADPPGVGDADGCALQGNIDEVDNDFSGVDCHLCHRMMVNEDPPKGEQPAYEENAQYWIDDAFCTTPFTDPCRRGPYDYEGGAAPPHEWAFSPYHQEGAFCATCHNVTNPVETLIDEKGVNTGIPYPIERTAREWQQSDFGDEASGSFAACQGCHMPDSTADPVYACVFQQVNRTGDLPLHQFAGGNAWIPAVLKDEYPLLDREESFDATIAWALDMLQNRSALVEVAPAGAAMPGEELPLDVKVTNLSGHKLPTGYAEGRRMWLHVTVRDAKDALLFESGAYDPVTAELDEDQQIKIYQVLQGIWDLNGTGECDHADPAGRELFHFVRNNCIALDNRVPPLGFTGGDDPETQPVNYSYPETSPGSGVLVNYDVTRYQVPLPLDVVSPLTVTATLRYQTSSKEYIEFLRDEALLNGFPDDCIPRSTGPLEMSRGEYLWQLWESTGKSSPVDMVAAAAEVPLTELLFEDGFESGDTSAWDQSVE